MSQPYKKAVYALVGLLAVLILVNIFIVMPQNRLEPPQPTITFTEPEPGSSTKDNIVSVDTLQAIREAETAEQHVLYSEEELARNPFFWTDEKIRKVEDKKNTTKKAQPKKPQLSMVIISEQQKQALLDGVLVTEGSTFHGYRVKRITGREVVLTGDIGDIRITLAAGGQDDKGKPQTDGIGIIER